MFYSVFPAQVGSSRLAARQQRNAEEAEQAAAVQSVRAEVAYYYTAARSSLKKMRRPL